MRRPVPTPGRGLATTMLLTLALGGCGAGDDGPEGSGESGDAGDAGVEAQGAAAASADGQETMNALTEAERADGWRLLFDGRSLEHWRGYRTDDVPASWVVRDGMLTVTGGGGDLVTRDTFGDFELSLEWRVQEAGNSGVMYRGDESADYLYMTAPEMQILDDAGHADGGDPLTSAGSVYALYPAPRGVVHPAGEWNHARIVADGAQVQHWLNGSMVAEYEQGSAEWNRLVADSKFAAWPGFGTLRSGHIGLLDHGDPVDFRNVKIRPIG